MHLHRLLIAASLLVVFCVPSAEATTAMELRSGMPETSLLPYLYLYEDRDDRFDLSKAASLLRDQDITSLGFKPMQADPLHRAKLKGTRWMHFSLHNSREDMAYDLLVLYTAHFQNLDLYIVDSDGQIRKIVGGYKIPSEDRYLDTRFTIYPIEVRPGETVNYFLTARTDQELNVPMVISGYQDFFEKELLVQSVNWLLIGVGLGLLIYNICLAIFAREVVFLLHGMVLLTGMVILGWGDANLFQIWDSPLLHSIYFAVAAVLAVTLLQQQFLRTYLETADQYPALDGLLKASMLVALCSLAAAPSMTAMQLLRLIVIVYLGIQLVDFVLSLYVAARGSKAAKIYSVALLWTAVLWLCGVFLPESGGFNQLLLLHFFTKLGLVTQIIIVTLAMGLRIHRIRLRGEDFQQRFQIISRENDELLKQNVRLQKVSHTDGLTQVGNRAFFELSFNMEWSRSLREKSTLALLLIDVDHFKRINDTHGHLLGDQCLIAIAMAIRGCLHRGSDRVMRYGGEEFAALLVGTDADGVLIVAERIRLATKSLEFDGFALTVSIGGASIVPRAGQKSSDFIELVDKALYAAKDRGRDNVVVRYSEFSHTAAAREQCA